MYHSLSADDQIFCSNPSHTNDFHEDGTSLLHQPSQKTEIIIIVSSDDSLFGLALKYNLKQNFKKMLKNT